MTYIKQLLEEALQERGFRVRQDRVFEYQLDTLRSLWVGFNLGSVDDDGSHLLYPRVGFYHATFEQIAKNVMPELSWRFAPALVRNFDSDIAGDALGFLWQIKFAPDESSEEVINTLAAAIRERGVPWATGFTKAEDFIIGASERDLGGDRRWRLPIALAVSGKTREAERVVQSELASADAGDSFYAEFAERFLSEGWME